MFFINILHVTRSELCNLSPRRIHSDVHVLEATSTITDKNATGRFDSYSEEAIIYHTLFNFDGKKRIVSNFESKSTEARNDMHTGVCYVHYYKYISFRPRLDIFIFMPILG